MRYVELPMKLRAVRREALVQRREMYRQRANYVVPGEELKKEVTIYRDDAFFDKFANEYFFAGTSRIVPRKRSRWTYRCLATRNSRDHAMRALRRSSRSEP